MHCFMPRWCFSQGPEWGQSFSDLEQMWSVMVDFPDWQQVFTAEHVRLKSESALK